MKVELRWPGKYGADGQRVRPPREGAPLRVVERWRGPAGHDPEAGENLLVHGDNLTTVAALLGAYEGKVDLIYVDPPFATGETFSLTTAVGDALAAELPAYDDREHDAGAFLQMLAPRLEQACWLLAPTGLLFVHLDSRQSHAVKLVLDELLGPRGFRGEIVWQPGNGAKAKQFFSRQHQVILAYSRGRRWTFRGDDPSLREPFAEGSLRSHFRHVDEHGRRFRRRVVHGREYIYYADEGKRVGSVWSDLPAMAAGSPVIDESTGYPTQKPLTLLSRLLTACSRPGDLVADLFCGSGTTLLAAERLGRRWLGCDVGALAIHTARKRLLALGDARPFALLRQGPDPDAPALRVRATAEDGGTVVEVQDFHTDEGALPEALRGRPDGRELLDAWAVGEVRDGVFEPRWQAQRTRRARGLALRSPPLPLGPAVAVAAHDLLGRRAEVRLG